MIALTLALLTSTPATVPDAAPEILGRVAPALDVTWIGAPPVPGAKATVLVFWATWCSSCKRRMPGLEAERGRYADRSVAFVGVAIDDDTAAVRTFAADAGELPFHVAHDTHGATWRAFGGPARIVGIPFGFVLDAERRVTWHGPLDDELFRHLDDTLAGAPDLDAARRAVAARAADEETERRIRRERGRYLELAADPRHGPEAARLGRLHLERYGEHVGAMCYLAFEICRNPSLTERDHDLAIAAGEVAHRASGERTPSVMNVLGLALFEGGRREEAVRLLERAREIALEAPAQHRFDLERIEARLAELRAAMANGVPGEVVVLPLEAHSQQVMLPVWIGAEGPFHFTLDTGSAMGVCLDERTRARLALPAIGTIGNTDGLGRVVQRDLVAVEGLRLRANGLPLEVSRALVADYAFVSPPGDPPVDGILGFPLFGERLLTIDYPRKEVRLADGYLAAGEDGVVLCAGADGRPHVALQVGERRISALVDTGYSGGVILPDSWRHELPLESKPVVVGRARGPNGLGASVRSAKPNVELRVGSCLIEVDRVSFLEGRDEAVIGRLALGALELTFDQRNGLVRFARPGEPRSRRVSAGRGPRPGARPGPRSLRG